MLMGWPLGWTSLESIPGEDWPALDGRWPSTGDLEADDEPPRLAEGVAYRRQRLRALGNGQIPLCVVLAWRELLPESEATA
jgi:hypothetical protein